MDPDLIDYYRSLEAMERDAAGRASCAQAREVHLALAARYAALINGTALALVARARASVPAEPEPEPDACRRPLSGSRASG